MFTENKYRRHASLVDRMSNTVGVDLEEEALRGRVSPGEIAEAVIRCTTCTQPEACEHWLATRQGTEETPPVYCRNADLFAELQP